MMGNIWEKMIGNPQALRSLYKDLPAPIGLQISGIELSYNGPALSLCVHFPQFPDFPSRKWHPDAKRFSAVFYFSFEEIQIKKFSTQNVASITCQTLEKPNMISISIAGADIDVTFVAYIGRLQSFSAN